MPSNEEESRGLFRVVFLPCGLRAIWAIAAVPAAPALAGTIAGAVFDKVADRQPKEDGERPADEDGWNHVFSFQESVRHLPPHGA